MTKEQFDKLYVGENLVVNCKTEQDAKEFLAMAHGFGYRWNSGELYTRGNNWMWHKSETCYRIKTGSYAHVKCYDREGRTVVTYPAQPKQFTKADLEDGYKVVYRNGDERFVLKRTNSLHHSDGSLAIYLSEFKETLLIGTSVIGSLYDIIKVYDLEDNLVYERIEKSPQQIEIERIETEMRKLADELKKVKENA